MVGGAALHGTVLHGNAVFLGHCTTPRRARRSALHCTGPHSTPTAHLIRTSPHRLPALFARSDFGKFYASKVFHDPVKDRQVLFGWVNYQCPGADWAGVQTFPRSVSLDPEDPSRIVTWPVEEIATLVESTNRTEAFVLKAGAWREIGFGRQLDVTVNVTGDLTGDSRFGVNALAARGSDYRSGVGATLTTVAADGGRRAQLHGHEYRLSSPSATTLRMLVDQSVVEQFAEGGRAVGTYQHCAPEPLTSGRLVVFNDGPGDLTVAAEVRYLATANYIPK